ncbi:MAG TPA: TlpA disulfide reductase family protein [Daejeonella sp.]|nr:TlpA disulfide reductase family protein [Daejeonella sp.]
MKNSSDKQVAFVKYDEFGNYQHFSLSPGKTTEIRFEHDYLNIFALENDRNVPYFFFDGDEVEITEVNDNYYIFDCSDLQRKNELQLAVTIFKAFLQDSLLNNNTPLLLKQTAIKIDSIFLSYPLTKVSSKFKPLTQLFYRYERLGRKQKYNVTNNIEEPFDQYWQKDFNHALQSYIITFRSYVLTYIPKFLNKDTLLKHLNHRFQNEHKEIALYTSMHMSYYRDKAWFRTHFDEYSFLSKDKNFSEKLSYLKLSDDVSKNAGEIILINPAKDTTTLKDLFAQLKGKVILIDLWASWCLPCIESLPYTNELAKSFDAKLFQVLYLNLDRELHLFNTYAAKNLKGKLTYNIVGNFNSSFAKLNKITSIPRYMIIDKQGRIVNASAPPPTDGELKSMIEKYL